MEWEKAFCVVYSNEKDWTDQVRKCSGAAAKEHEDGSGRKCEALRQVFIIGQASVDSNSYMLAVKYKVVVIVVSSSRSKSSGDSRTFFGIWLRRT